MVFRKPIRLLAITLVFAFSIFPFAAAAAPWPEECKLERQASLPFVITHGHIQIEVALNGVPRHFMVDTGGLMSSVTEAVAAEQKLGTFPIRDDLKITGIGGERTRRYAIADTLTFAKLKAQDVRLLVAPSLAPGEDGVLAPDYLRNFDVDIDFANKTLNLFRPHRCDGDVVYWGGSAVILPMTVTDTGHIRVPAALDGADLEAMVDTGAPASLIGARTVAVKFNMDPGKGDITIRGAVGGTTTATAKRFGELGLGGAKIKNPPLLVTADETAWRSDYSDLLLGLRELSLFHVYIAYRERKLYLSPLPAQ
jgi:predicted aspartyl protease